MQPRPRSANDAPPFPETAFSDTAAQVKETVSDAARAAGDYLEDTRESAADGMERAASMLHENARRIPGGEKISRIAHGAAEKLDRTATYVRDHDFDDMMHDVETVVKNNPAPALLIAASVGFIVGWALSRNE